MDLKRAKGAWIARACVALGLAVTLYAAWRLAHGAGGALLLVVGLPVVAYGAFMLRAVRRVRP